VLTVAVSPLALGRKSVIGRRRLRLSRTQHETVISA
jgi:hypothetical protein